MAKMADVVAARTGAARCTQLLVVLLVVSLISNIILGCLYGEAGCAVEETMEPKGIKVEAAEKIISHTHSNVGLIIDASKEGDECECLSPTWQILEILVLAALITVLLNYGSKATWKVRGWWNTWRNDIKEKRKQKVLEELRVAEQELGRCSALQNAREMQA